MQSHRIVFSLFEQINKERVKKIKRRRKENIIVQLGENWSNRKQKSAQKQ